MYISPLKTRLPPLPIFQKVRDLRGYFKLVEIPFCVCCNCCFDPLHRGVWDFIFGGCRCSRYPITAKTPLVLTLISGRKISRLLSLGVFELSISGLSWCPIDLLSSTLLPPQMRWGIVYSRSLDHDLSTLPRRR